MNLKTTSSMWQLSCLTWSSWTIAFWMTKQWVYVQLSAQTLPSLLSSLLCEHSLAVSHLWCISSLYCQYQPYTSLLNQTKQHYTVHNCTLQWYTESFCLSVFLSLKWGLGDRTEDSSVFLNCFYSMCFCTLYCKRQLRLLVTDSYWQLNSLDC